MSPVNKILDEGVDLVVAEMVREALKAEGYSAEEAIPGLIKAIVAFAEETFEPVQALDEATDLLTDATIEVESDGL